MLKGECESRGIGYFSLFPVAKNEGDDSFI